MPSVMLLQLRGEEAQLPRYLTLKALAVVAGKVKGKFITQKVPTRVSGKETRFFASHGKCLTIPYGVLKNLSR